MNRRLADVTLAELLVVVVIAGVIVALIFGLRADRHFERQTRPAPVVGIR